jgi:four helix bundle protein
VATSSIAGHRVPVKSFQDLEIWQRAIDLAESVYRISESFPRDERFGMTSQMRRASVSVASNIAEGWGRGSRAEFVRFLAIARGSLYELITQLTIARRIGYISPERAPALSEEMATLSRMLLSQLRALRVSREANP